MTLPYVVKVLLKPGCWYQNYRLSKWWDKELNHLLDTEKFTSIDAYEATIGPYRVWITNHPYSSFTVHLPTLPPTAENQVRPRRRTILRAADKLKRDYLEEYFFPTTDQLLSQPTN